MNVFKSKRLLLHERLANLDVGALDTDMADARKDRRTLLSLKIRYKSATLKDFIERYSMDISGGGVFIKAKKPLAVGTLLKFEFVLQDQSSLIHGVGRVAWRREEVEATENNPAGMGIKFIKMDPESRAVVQRIVDERARPGVFDRGKEGVSVQPQEVSEPPEGADSTRVSHVSEFLVSAFETGGAGETATREARASRERKGTAIGAFRKPADSGSRSSVAPTSHSVATAFGGPSSHGAASLRSSAAPAMDVFEDDDFVDNETTTVQALPTSDFPEPEADATVVAAESPFERERRQTPVVAAVPESVSPLEEEAPGPVSPLEAAVPDLFGPDSFGPAPGEVIDASLLDPAVPTVPPKASALPRGAMPDAPGLPNEAFRVPQAPKAVRDEPAPAEPSKRKSRVGLLVAFILLLLVAGGGVAAWQLGFLDGVLPSLKMSALVTKAPPVVGTAPKPAERAEVEPSAAEDEAAGAVEGETQGAEGAQGAATEAATDEAASKNAADGPIKITVTSVPKGAFVSINGKGAGRTPFEIEHEVGTKLAFFAKARGFLARRQQVVVGEGTTAVKLVLPTLPYEVEVVSNPPGARASAVGGGETTTPGTLRFRSMPASRKIVVSKDGYSTMSLSVKRSSFVEEKSRMFSAVSVTLAAEAADATVPAPAPEAPAVPAATAEPEPTPEPAAEPEAPVEAAPSEPSADDVAQ
jgi:uncharacterized protein (TIGR02266 family)